MGGQVGAGQSFVQSDLTGMKLTGNHGVPHIWGSDGVAMHACAI